MLPVFSSLLLSSVPAVPGFESLVPVLLQVMELQVQQVAVQVEASVQELVLVSVLPQPAA